MLPAKTLKRRENALIALLNTFSMAFVTSAMKAGLTTASDRTFNKFLVIARGIVNEAVEKFP